MSKIEENGPKSILDFGSKYILSKFKMCCLGIFGQNWALGVPQTKIWIVPPQKNGFLVPKGHFGQNWPLTAAQSPSVHRCQHNKGVFWLVHRWWCQKLEWCPKNMIFFAFLANKFGSVAIYSKYWFCQTIYCGWLVGSMTTSEISA